MGGEDPIRERRPHHRVDQLLLGVELEILASTSGIADPAIVEFDDKRLAVSRSPSTASQLRRDQPGAHAITDRRHDLVGPAGHHDRSSASTGPWNQTS